jgi:hypothetical protein
MVRPISQSVTLNGRVFDQSRAEAAVRELLCAIGEDPDRHGLMETPARVARSYREMFAGLYTDPDSVLDTTFDEQHDELVLVKESRCIPPANIIWWRFMVWLMSDTSPVMTVGSRVCPRSPDWSTCMPSGHKSRSGSPLRSPTL